MPLEPFDPKKHKPQDMGKGGLTTEYLVTEHSPDGKVWNIPSVWWDEDGHPVEITNPALNNKLATQYERHSGKKFPRYKSIEGGVSAAKKRSSKGGATGDFLAAPRKKLKED